MLHRRSTATALVAVLLPGAALLSSCGFDYPTDRVNTIAAGVNNRDAKVDVLGARVVAYAEGNGRLIGTLVYNDNEADQPAQLVSVEGTGVAVQVDEVEIPGNKAVNLAGDDVQPLAVSGDFTAGDVVTLTFTFSTEESVSLDVPVVKNCDQYADIATPSPEGGETGGAADHADESGSHTEESDATYLCEHPTETAEDSGH